MDFFLGWRKSTDPGETEQSKARTGPPSGPSVTYVSLSVARTARRRPGEPGVVVGLVLSGLVMVKFKLQLFYICKSCTRFCNFY